MGVGAMITFWKHNFSQLFIFNKRKGTSIATDLVKIVVHGAYLIDVTFAEEFVWFGDHI